MADEVLKVDVDLPDQRSLVQFNNLGHYMVITQDKAKQDATNFRAAARALRQAGGEDTLANRLDDLTGRLMAWIRWVKLITGFRIRLLPGRLELLANATAFDGTSVVFFARAHPKLIDLVGAGRLV